MILLCRGYIDRYQFVVHLIVGVLVFILGYKLDIGFLQEKHKKLQSELIIVRQKVSDKAQAMRSTKKAAQKKITTDLQEGANLEVINVLDFLEKKIFLSGVKHYSFKPISVNDRDGVMSCSIKLELKGRYKDLLLFISSLINAPYLVVIEELFLKKEPGADLSMQITLSIYKSRYKLPTKEVGDAKIILDNVLDKDVFKKSGEKVGLDYWFSRELNFLGLITKAQKNFGVVSDPLGNIYQVTIGDKIGVNQSEITAINKRGIAVVDAEGSIYIGK